MGMDFGVKTAAKDYDFGGGQSDRFQFQKGDNRVRVLAMSEGFLATHFVNNKPVPCAGKENGCEYHGEKALRTKEGKVINPSVKKLMYVLNLLTEKIEMVYMPYSVVRELQRLADDTEWGFTEMPMPYSINIKYNPDAAPPEIYKALASSKREPVAENVIEELLGKKPLKQIEEKIRNKQPKEPTTETISVEEPSQ